MVNWARHDEGADDCARMTATHGQTFGPAGCGCEVLSFSLQGLLVRRTCAGGAVEGVGRSFGEWPNTGMQLVEQSGRSTISRKYSMKISLPLQATSDIG